MTIIDSFQVSAIARDPFADWLTVTFPRDFDAAVRDGLEAILGQLGAVARSDDQSIYLVGRLTVDMKLAKIGAVYVKSKGQGFFMVSASGGVLDRMRDCGLFTDYLAFLGSFPHRITRLHASCDYAVVSPGEVVQGVKALASSGEVQLSRKAIPPASCRWLFSPGVGGVDTGTVYLGEQKKSDITAKVYDKQQERVSKGFPDPGSIVRIELSLGSELGLTLRDVADPAGVYYQYAGKMLVQRPEGLPEWSGNGEGFVLPPRVFVSPLDRLKRLLESSMELHQLVDLAVDAHKGHAAEVLARIFRERCEAKLAGV